MLRTLEWKQGKPCQPSGLVYYVEAWISHKGNGIKFTIVKVTIDGVLYYSLWVDGVMQYPKNPMISEQTGRPLPQYRTKLEAAEHAEEIRHERYTEAADEAD